MHAQPAGNAFDPERARLERFAVQIQGQRLVGGDRQPRALPAHRHPLQRGLLALGDQGPDSGGDFAFQRRHERDVQQPIVDEGIRAQHLPAAGLAAVADAQRDEIARPCEVLGFEARVAGFDPAHARQSADDVSQAAEHLLQAFLGLGGDGRTETARRQIDAPVLRAVGFDAQQIHRLRRRRTHQVERRFGVDRNLRGGGEIVGGPQRQHRQRRQRIGRCVTPGQRIGQLAHGAVAAAGDHRARLRGDGFVDVTSGVARFPGDPHRQPQAAPAHRFHRQPHVVVVRLLAVEDQPGVGIGCAPRGRTIRIHVPRTAATAAFICATTAA